MRNAPTFETFCGCSGIGIDVSKATLEVVGVAETAVWRITLDNREVAIEPFAQALQAGRLCRQGRL